MEVIFLLLWIIACGGAPFGYDWIQNRRRRPHEEEKKRRAELSCRADQQNTALLRDNNLLVGLYGDFPPVDPFRPPDVTKDFRAYEKAQRSVQEVRKSDPFSKGNYIRGWRLSGKYDWYYDEVG